MKEVKVILVDDHIMVRKGLKSLIEQDKSIEVIDEASDGKEAVQKVIKYLFIPQ